LENHEDGTCLWSLGSREWDSWLNKKIRVLWIRGIPGAGKTVLASFLYESVRNTLKSLAGYQAVYYYCYYGHNQDETAAILKWTITQLCRQTDHIPENVWNIYKTGQEPPISELLDALETILSSLNHAYIFLDAIDESLQPRSKILDVIKTLAIDPRFEKIQLLVTSREYLDIESILSSISTPVSMENDLIQEDIRIYVRSSLQQNRRFSSWPNFLKTEVEDTIATSAKGM
jgi:hypothetical protein